MPQIRWLLSPLQRHVRHFHTPLIPRPPRRLLDNHVEHLYTHTTRNSRRFGGRQNTLVAGPTRLPEHGWTHMLEPFLDPREMICYSDGIRLWFLSALGFLELLTITWFGMIAHVAVRVVKGLGADDIRSDDEVENERDVNIDGNAKSEATAGANAKDDSIGGGINNPHLSLFVLSTAPDSPNKHGCCAIFSPLDTWSGTVRYLVTF